MAKSTVSGTTMSQSSMQSEAGKVDDEATRLMNLKRELFFKKRKEIKRDTESLKEYQAKRRVIEKIVPGEGKWRKKKDQRDKAKRDLKEAKRLAILQE